MDEIFVVDVMFVKSHQEFSFGPMSHDVLGRSSSRFSTCAAIANSCHSFSYHQCDAAGIFFSHYVDDLCVRASSIPLPTSNLLFLPQKWVS